MPHLHRIGIVWSLAGEVPQRIVILVLVPYLFAPRERKTRPLSRSIPPQAESRLYPEVAVRFAIYAWKLVTWVMLTGSAKQSAKDCIVAMNGSKKYVSRRAGRGLAGPNAET